MKTLAEKMNNIGLVTIYYANKLFGRSLGQAKPMVLCYHAVENDTWRFSMDIAAFEQQMKFLKQTKRVVPLSEIVNGKAGDNVVALTFDDGYENNFLHVAPILKKLQLPATLFVLGNAKQANRRELDNQKGLMSNAAIKTLHAMGWEIGFHTNTHANLWQAADEELEEEIVTGKKKLEKALGITMKYFAYPRGLYSDKIVAYVKKAGFAAAFTVDGGAIDYREDKMKMRRIGIESLMTGKKFEALVSPLGLAFQKLYMDMLKMKEKIGFMLRGKDKGERGKKGLKIAILDFDDIKNPLLAAGQASATYEVGKRLAARGHKVTVISSRYPGYKDRVEDGIEYKHIGIGTKNIRLNNALYIVSVPFAVMKLQADLIIECFTAPISTLLSPLFTKIPVVVVPSSFEAERFAKLYHLPFDLIERYGAKVYTYHLPLSDYNDEKMKRYNKNIIAKIVPEGVSEYFFTIKKKKPKHILFLGRFDQGQKGIDLLLQAYKKVADRISLPLIIAGRGPDEEKIRSLIQRLDLDKQVTIVGPAYGEKKEKLLAESAAVVLSSRNESFSCFALEALASGAPLVSFKIPGLSWLNDDCAIRVKPFDTDAYANALLSVQNERKMNLMSNNARAHAKKFTWDEVVNEYEGFFYEVLRREAYAN